MIASQDDSESAEPTASEPGADEQQSAEAPERTRAAEPAAQKPQWAPLVLEDRTSRIRARRVIGVVVAVLAVLGGLGIWHLVATHRGSSVVYPGQLMGLARYTGPEEQVVERNWDKAVQSSWGDLLSAPVAAVYGVPNGRWFAVVTGVPCASSNCVIGTGGQLAQYMRAHGYANARAFPPGPGGLALVCLSYLVRGAQFDTCAWLDQGTVGQTVFPGRSVSSIGDAAAQTRQIRAAIEH